jgi:hypothetical protein
MDKLFKVNEAIEFGYQVPNAETGLSGVVAEIYLPDKSKSSLFPDVNMVEVASTGTYRGSFTPDEVGVWEVIFHKANGDGQVVKSFSVGLYNVEQVGLAVDALQSALTALGDVATSGDVDAAVTAIEGAITALGTVAVQGDVTGAVTALEGYILALDVANGTDVTNTQTAITNAITAAQGVITGAITTTQGIITGAITTSQGVITDAIGDVKDVVDGIALSVASLDTPPMAF